MKEKVAKIFQKPWMGVAWLLLFLVFFIFVCVPIQMKYGMVGVAITELLILIAALIPIFLSGQKFSEVFSFKRPSIRNTIGAILMWMGALALVLLVNIFSMFLFPTDMAGLGEAMGTLFSSVSFIVATLIIGVMPAICEEALHRAYILSTMKKIRPDWLVVLIMGILFGVFHLDPLRFAGTALLGALLTYIMLKTRNFLYPMLIHLINNMIPLAVSFAFFGEEANGAEIGELSGTNQFNLLTLGSMFLLASVSPLLIAGGAALLRKKIRADEEPELKKKWNRKKLRVIIGAVILSGLMFISGFTMLLVGSFSNIVLNVSEEFDWTQNSGAKEYIVEIKDSGKYVLTYEQKADKGLILFEIVADNGEILESFFSQHNTINKVMSLEPGTVKIWIHVMDKDIRSYCEKNGIEYIEENFSNVIMQIDEKDPIHIQVKILITKAL